MPGLGRIVETADAVQRDWLMTGAALESQGLGGLAADVERFLPAVVENPTDPARAGGDRN
ncbi:MAG: hypothetical protein NVS1B6_09790 [Steroidobacteraceae bacterium]